MFVIYIFSDFTRVRLRGKRMKNIPWSWVWADRFPFNDLFHAIIYFIAWINVDSSLSRGHWKLENCSRAKRERQFFLIFSNFLYFKEKIFYYSIKKKFLRISSINSHWSILSSRESMLSYAIEYQRIDAVNEENFFFQISHASHFQRKLCASLTKISLNFRSSTTYDYFLYRIVLRLPFSYPIEYQKITFDEGKRSHLLAARGFS